MYKINSFILYNHLYGNIHILCMFSLYLIMHCLFVTTPFAETFFNGMMIALKHYITNANYPNCREVF